MMPSGRLFMWMFPMLLCVLYSVIDGQSTTDNDCKNSKIAQQYSDNYGAKLNELQMRVEKLEGAITSDDYGRQRMDDIRHGFRGADILVQQRYGGAPFFNKSWAEFKIGFGNKTRDYWIGNDRLHELTIYNEYKLRVELLAMNAQWYYVEYGFFIVDAESNQYQLHAGLYNGTAGDCFISAGGSTSNWVQNGMRFSTWDRDNDKDSVYNCARTLTGGFWYNDCGCAKLNSADKDYGFAWGLLKNATGSVIHNVVTSRMILIRKAE